MVSKLRNKQKHSNEVIRSIIFRYIVRHPFKFTLVALLSLSFVILSGFLSEAITHREREIDYFFNNIIISAKVRQARTETIHAEDFNMVSSRIVSRIADINNGFIRSIYLETGERNYYLLSTRCDKDLLDGTLYDMIEGLGHPNIIFSFNDFESFMNEYRERVLNLPVIFTAATDAGVFELNEETLVQFAFGSDFNEKDFYFNTSNEIGDLLPVIAGKQIMEERGLSIGDVAYIVNASTRDIHQVRIIGMAKGFMLGEGDRGFCAETLIFLPIDALETVRGIRITHYIRVIFELDPSRNRENSYFRDAFHAIGEDFSILRFELDDGELRSVVEPLEQALLLLQVLYPVVIIGFLIIATSFAVLLSFQYAKAAAIMIVLGAKKGKVRGVLIFIQMIVCMAGLAFGQIVYIFTIGISETHITLLFLAVLYFISVLTGVTIGAILVTNRSPLSLLQERE